MENKTINFKGVKSVILASCLYKQLLSLFQYQILSNYLYKKYGNYKSFEEFIIDCLKKESLVDDLLNTIDFSEKEIELICSFAKDTNGINFDKSNISCLTTIKIKEIMKSVIVAFFNQDIYFIDKNTNIDLQENLKECIKNGNADVDFKDLVNV